MNLQNLLSHPAGIAAIAVLGLLLLVGIIKIVAWVISGLLNVGFLLIGIALAGLAAYGWKTQDQMLMLGGMGGLLLVVLIAVATKRPVPRG